jgi:hypothetical protein
MPTSMHQSFESRAELRDSLLLALVLLPLLRQERGSRTKL